MSPVFKAGVTSKNQKGDLTSDNEGDILGKQTKGDVLDAKWSKDFKESVTKFSREMRQETHSNWTP